MRALCATWVVVAAWGCGKAGDKAPSSKTSGPPPVVEVRIDEVTTPGSLEYTAGVDKTTSRPTEGYRFVVVTASVKHNECIGPDPLGPSSFEPDAAPGAKAGPPPKKEYLVVATRYGILIGTDGTRHEAIGGGTPKQYSGLCTSCESESLVSCAELGGWVGMSFVFSVPTAFDYAKASFEYEGVKTPLPAAK